MRNLKKKKRLLDMNPEKGKVLWGEKKSSEKTGKKRINPSTSPKERGLVMEKGKV